MLSRLQDHPHFLELAYAATMTLLRPFRRWLRPEGRIARPLARLEHALKGPLFDCHMCGQCVLHSTGMTCPMTCPKNLRNGPCGGVRLDGHCEVKPEMPCVWVQAYERSLLMPVYGSELRRVLPPLNRTLHRTSAWVNDLARPEQFQPAGWIPADSL